MALIAAGIVGLVVWAIQSRNTAPPAPPPAPASRVILLPDANGVTGALLVRADGKEQLLSTAYGSATVRGSGSAEFATADEQEVKQRYAATLAARPMPPVSFTVFFEFGSAVDIAPVFLPTLDKLRAAIGDYPAAEITVIGHTDRVGSLESNDRLSLQRAETVRDLIIKAGIQAASIEVAGRGEREPLVPTADGVAEARNRRVEINLR